MCALIGCIVLYPKLSLMFASGYINTCTIFYFLTISELQVDNNKLKNKRENCEYHEVTMVKIQTTLTVASLILCIVSVAMVTRWCSFSNPN